MSSSSAAKSNYPRPCKYKDSCDACARSKVKCDKARPSCDRCTRTDIECRYSLARRGKARTISNPNTTSQGHTHTAPPENESFFADSGLNFIDQDFLAQSDFATSQFPDFNAVYSSHFDSQLSSASTADSPIGGEQTTGHVQEDRRAVFGSSPDCRDLLWSPNTQSGQPLPDWGDIHIDHMSNTNSTMLLSQPIQLDPLLSPASSVTTSQTFDTIRRASHGGHVAVTASSTAGKGTCSGQHKDCIRLALSTFESLHIPSNTCVLLPKTSAIGLPGMDIILEKNKAAIENVLTILACPCSTHEPKAILLALICSQVIDAYQRISLIRRNLVRAGEGTITDSQSGRQLESSSNCGNLALQMSSTSDTTMTTDLDVPIAIGAYMLDGNAKRKMISSILLSELEKVGEALEKFTCHEWRGGRGASSNSRDGGELVILTFKSSLASKLQATMRAVQCELG